MLTRCLHSLKVSPKVASDQELATPILAENRNEFPSTFRCELPCPDHFRLFLHGPPGYFRSDRRRLHPDKSASGDRNGVGVSWDGGRHASCGTSLRFLGHGYCLVFGLAMPSYGNLGNAF